MKKILLLFMAIALAACNPKASSTVKAANASGLTTNSIISSVQCAQVTSTTQGMIYEASPVTYAAGDATGTFEDRVKAMLSATVLPTEVGTISGQLGAATGLRFSGKIKLDQSGNVIAALSKVTVSVYDSIWVEAFRYDSSARGIDLSFDSARAGHSITGQFNVQTGVSVLTVKDSYGELRFEGVLDAQNFSGILKFNNFASVVGSNAKGTIGNFTIPRCVFVQ